MARILALDEVPVSLRNHLVRALRSFDEAILLPQAERRDDTGVFKNIVFRLSGTEPNVPISIFNPRWFTGVSAVRVDGPVVAQLLRNSDMRHAAMRRLRDAIPSEVADSSLQVGPALDCDESDRDRDEWIAGFDGPNCFVGLYCADHSSAPDPARRGMDRVHQASYLVCKAGAGVAGATFHMRLVAALKKGLTLEECLEKGTEPGPAALRRVSMAGSRNRARILELAAKALGFPLIDTVPDQSSSGKYRSAVTQVDVAVNSLRRIEDAAQPTYQYTTAVDAAASQGLMSMSNAADGVVLMLSPGGEVRQTLRNEAHCTIPYASRRLVKDGDLIVSITKEHKEAIRHGDFAHPDSDFVRDRFVWKNRQFPGLEALAAKADVEPLALWGSYDKEDYLSRFARELGVAQCQVVRLRPTAVCLAGVDSGKLRAALRNIDSSSRIPASTRSAETAPAPPKPAPKPVAASVSVASGGDGSTAIDDLFAKRLNVLRAKRETAQLEERVMCMATTTSAGNEDVHEDDNASGVFEYHHDHV
jgi:hypothetical protein